MDYCKLLTDIANKYKDILVQEDYDSFIGFAIDAEDEPVKAKCIENYLTSLASDQSVNIEDVSLENADSMDLFDLAGEV